MIPALLSAQDPAAGLAGGGPDMTRYLLVCAFLILLVAGLGYGFKRLAHGSLKGRAAKRALATLDVLPLGGKQRVAVVRCYDKSYLIGLGDKEVRLLAALDEESASSAEAPESTVLEAKPRRASEPRPGGFRETLRKRLGEGAKPEAEPEPEAPAPRRRARAERTQLPGGGLFG